MFNCNRRRKKKKITTNKKQEKVALFPSMHLCVSVYKVGVFKYIVINFINYKWDVEQALRLKRELNTSYLLSKNRSENDF